MVVLIYKEGDQQFDPLIIKSQFLRNINNSNHH